jgi:DNA-binding MarR family transcriptional regulator
MGTVSELINELQGLGYVERRPDAKDRRAKLIYPTTRGRKLFDDAGERVAEIEARWARIVGKRRFSDACYVLQDLLDALDPDSSAKQ